MSYCVHPTTTAVRSRSWSPLWSKWIELLPLEEGIAPYIFNVSWDAAEDFNVSTFNGVHGYYRQALGHLRSALEGLTFAAYFAKRKDAAGLRGWLSVTTRRRSSATPESFELVYCRFRDVMAMCLVLLSVGSPSFVMPTLLPALLDTPSGAWTAEAKAAALVRASAH